MDINQKITEELGVKKEIPFRLLRVTEKKHTVHWMMNSFVNYMND